LVGGEYMSRLLPYLGLQNIWAYEVIFATRRHACPWPSWPSHARLCVASGSCSENRSAPRCQCLHRPAACRL